MFLLLILCCCFFTTCPSVHTEKSQFLFLDVLGRRRRSRGSDSGRSWDFVESSSPGYECECYGHNRQGSGMRSHKNGGLSHVPRSGSRHVLRKFVYEHTIAHPPKIWPSPVLPCSLRDGNGMPIQFDDTIWLSIGLLSLHQQQQQQQ